jgi:hypothetical protein
MTRAPRAVSAANRLCGMPSILVSLPPTYSRVFVAASASTRRSVSARKFFT